MNEVAKILKEAMMSREEWETLNRAASERAKLRRSEWEKYHKEQRKLAWMMTFQEAMAYAAFLVVVNVWAILIWMRFR